jgi:hypothetical protein
MEFFDEPDANGSNIERWGMHVERLPTDGSSCPNIEWRLRYVALLLAALSGQWSRLSERNRH